MDGVIKHISGDNMRLIQKVVTNDTDKDNNDIDKDTNDFSKDIDDLSLPNEYFDIDNSDTESNFSDISDLEFLNIDETNQTCNKRKKYRTEVDRLGVGFSLPATRRRSGRI